MDRLRLILLSSLLVSVAAKASDNPEVTQSVSGPTTDTVLINRGHSRLDKRYQYPKELLTMALEKTSEKYGVAAVKETAKTMTRERALLELERGEKLHVMAEAVKPDWENRLIPVRFPIRKGLQGYRLFLIKKQNQALFADIETFADLADIATGSGEQWSTRWAMEAAGMQVVTGANYESLFSMLAHDRFQSFGRGINEIFTELELHQRIYSDLMIEPGLALYIPLPTYFFVSPKHPELARRIELGLAYMLKDGSFDKLFYQYHGDDIAQANLPLRKIFRIDNPNLSSETPLQNPLLWYVP